jgi:hypothetical protein
VEELLRIGQVSHRLDAAGGTAHLLERRGLHQSWPRLLRNGDPEAHSEAAHLTP